MPTPPASTPTIESLTVREGDLEVTVSRSGLLIKQVGPRGGRTSVAEFSNVKVERMIVLLGIAQQHQRLLADILEGKA